MNKCINGNSLELRTLRIMSSETGILVLMKMRTMGKISGETDLMELEARLRKERKKK